MTTLDKKLKNIRELRKLSMTELAKISGVHQTTISSIETGRNLSPGLETIEKLSAALNVSPLYFFSEKAVAAVDVFDNLPADVACFLLQSDSAPYLMLSAEAFNNGISSEDLRELCKVLLELNRKKAMNS